MTVCCRERPAWLRAVVEDPGVDVADPAEALACYASIA